MICHRVFDAGSRPMAKVTAVCPGQVCLCLLILYLFVLLLRLLGKILGSFSVFIKPPHKESNPWLKDPATVEAVEDPHKNSLNDSGV